MSTQPFTFHPDKFEAFLAQYHNGDATKWKHNFDLLPSHCVKIMNQHGLILMKICWDKEYECLAIWVKNSITKQIHKDLSCTTNEDLILFWRGAHMCPDCSLVVSRDTQTKCNVCTFIAHLKVQGSITENEYECSICKQDVKTVPIYFDEHHYACKPCAMKVLSKSDAKCPECRLPIRWLGGMMCSSNAHNSFALSLLPALNLPHMSDDDE